MVRESITPEAKLAEISKEIVKVEKQATNIVIASADDMKGATVFLSGVKAKIDKAEEIRVSLVKPLNDHVKTINAMFKPEIEKLMSIMTKVKRAVSDYAIKQEREARAEEERLAALQAKRNERREEKGLAPDFMPAPTIEREEQTVRTAHGSSTLKKSWQFKIDDVHSLPAKYKKTILELAFEKGVADMVIRQAVRGGAREISGVKIYEDFDVAVTSNL